MSDYIASDYKVIKFHGSVNWGHRVMNKIENIHGLSQLQVASEVIERRPDLVIDNSYEIVDQSLEDIRRGYPIGKSGENPVLPALAVPVENKSGDELPPEHRKVLDECLPQIEKILVVGWRANEARFLEILGQGLAKGKVPPKVMIVSRSEQSAKEVGNKIRQKLRQTGILIGDSYEVSKGGFTGAVRNGETEAFIKS